MPPKSVFGGPSQLNVINHEYIPWVWVYVQMEYYL